MRRSTLPLAPALTMWTLLASIEGARNQGRNVPRRDSRTVVCDQMVSGVTAPVTVSVIPAEVTWAAMGW